jgi:hypothetical protein
MIVNNEKINFFKYKNKKSLNNHKITGFNLPHIFRTIKIIRSKSNIVPKINAPMRKSMLVIENNNMKKNKNIKRLQLFKDNKLKTKTLSKYEYTPNASEALFYSNYNSPNNKNNNNNFNNDINNNFYYNLICLGRKTDNKEINKVNSPLIKYFLYNISQNNNRRKFNCAPLHNYYNNFNSHKKRKIKNLETQFKSPNYSLIEKKLKIKYNELNCNRNNLPKILNNKYFSIPIKNPKETESEEDSSSDKSQFNSFVEKTIFENDNKNFLKNNNINKLYRSLSLFNRIKSFKKRNNMFLNTPSKLNFITNVRNKNFFKEFK